MNDHITSSLFAIIYFTVNGEAQTDSELYTRRVSMRIRDDAFDAARDLLADATPPADAATDWQLDRVTVTYGGRKDRLGDFIEGSETRFEFYPPAFGEAQPPTDSEESADAQFARAFDNMVEAEIAKAEANDAAERL